MMELPSQSGLISPHSALESSGEDDTPSRQQIRKSNKPLLEKKRRARINRSLEDLKALVLEALKKDSARYSKLEKADILEMTVKHLREVQRGQMSAAMTIDPNVVNKFHSGFEECAQEVHRYLGSIDGLSPEVRMRLMQHLGSCVNKVNPMNPMSYPASPMYGGLPCASSPQSLPGLSMRCSLPFGGLALSSPESPTLPVSPSSFYSPNDYHHSIDVAMTPQAYASTSRGTSREIMSRKRENSENIAPSRSMRPLGEKQDNNRSFDFGDRNNNICAPMAKRFKVEDRSQYGPSLYHPQGHMVQHNLLEVSVKGEPVWRPW